MCRKIPKSEWIATKKRSCGILVFALCAVFFGFGAGRQAAGASDVPGPGSCTVDFDGTGITLSGAHLVNGGSLIIDNAAITKTGGPVGEVDDAYNFYGLNSIVVVGDGSTARITNCTLDADSNGLNAIVATNGGAIAVNGVTITTSGGSSRGLHATYGGTITAENIDITTGGAHSAPLATDRGGGPMGDNRRQRRAYHVHGEQPDPRRRPCLRQHQLDRSERGRRVDLDRREDGDDGEHHGQLRHGPNRHSDRGADGRRDADRNLRSGRKQRRMQRGSPGSPVSDSPVRAFLPEKSVADSFRVRGPFHGKYKKRRSGRTFPTPPCASPPENA